MLKSFRREVTDSSFTRAFDSYLAKTLNLKVGDEIVVKATGYDRKGKLNLSRKELLQKLEKKDNKKEEVSE